MDSRGGRTGIFGSLSLPGKIHRKAEGSSTGASQQPSSHNKGQSVRDMLAGTVSRRVLMETLEPRILLSADLFPIAGAISAPGEEDSYAITLAEPARVTFDALMPSEVSWRLSGDEGTLGAWRVDSSDANTRLSPPSFDLARGTYQLDVFGATGQTGDYAFALRDLADATEITNEVPASVTLVTGRETQSFKIDALAGQTLNLVKDTSVPNISAGGWLVLDPNGNSVLHQSTLSDASVLLAQDGIYTVLVEGRLSADVPLAFDFHVALGEAHTLPYTVGSTAAGGFETNGDINIHVFDIASDGRYALSGTGGNFTQTWKLRGPEGEIAGTFNFPNAGAPEVFDLKAGRYSLVVSENSAALPDYTFLLAETGEGFAGPATDITAFTGALGAVLRGDLAGTGQTHRYDFDITERTHLRLDNLLYDFDLSARLEGPEGREILLSTLATGNGFAYRATVDPGRYSLVVSSRNEAGGSYGLVLADDTITAPQPVPGQIVSDLGADAAFRRFEITGTAGETLFVDPVVLQSAPGSGVAVNLTVRGPHGDSIFTSAITAS